MSQETKLENMAYKIDSYTADADRTQMNVSDQTKATIADMKKTLGKFYKKKSVFSLRFIVFQRNLIENVTVQGFQNMIFGIMTYCYFHPC